MTVFHHKSIFLHNVPAVLNGDLVNIAEWLVSHKFTAILPKCVDGVIEFTHLDKFGVRTPNVSQLFVDIMTSYGIEVIGWGFNYGNDGDAEGRKAAEVCNKLKLKGWVFDFEKRIEDYPDSIARAGKVIGTFNKTNKDTQKAFCSWAFYWATSTGSQIHEPDLARFMMEYCDVAMPMVYWNKQVLKVPVHMSNAEVLKYVSTSDEQHKRITDKPVVPVYRAYQGDGGLVNAGNVLAAGLYAKENHSGASWWVLDHAVKMPEIADALGQVPGWAVPPVVEPPAPQIPPTEPLPKHVDATLWPDHTVTGTWK